LIAWAHQGGQPVLQGRADLALHFLYGALAEATLVGGDAAAVLKEQLDARAGRPFDWDDLAAGVAGAEWVRRARAEAGWAAQWAAGQKTLAANLPAFRYGTAPPADDGLARIRHDIQLAYNR
jgi:hypothetical protein